MITPILFLSIYIISTIIHLYASLKGNEKLRAWTKGFILTGLIGFYLSAAQSINVLFLLALIFSLVGDVLLINKSNKFFILGGIGFMLGHIFFILSFSSSFILEYIPIYIIGIMTYIAMFVKTVSVFRNEKLFIGTTIYLFLNILMNITSFIRAVNIYTPNTIPFVIAAILGAGLFYISDVLLFEKKRHYSNKIQFFVMLTYALGELLLVISFLL